MYCDLYKMYEFCPFTHSSLHLDKAQVSESAFGLEHFDTKHQPLLLKPLYPWRHRLHFPEFNFMAHLLQYNKHPQGKHSKMASSVLHFKHMTVAAAPLLFPDGSSTLSSSARGKVSTSACCFCGTNTTTKVSLAFPPTSSVLMTCSGVVS